MWADDHGWVSRGMIPDDVLLASTPGLRRRKGLDDPGAGGEPATQPVASGSSTASDTSRRPGDEPPPADAGGAKPLFT